MLIRPSVVEYLFQHAAKNAVDTARPCRLAERSAAAEAEIVGNVSAGEGVKEGSASCGDACFEARCPMPLGIYVCEEIRTCNEDKRSRVHNFAEAVGKVAEGNGVTACRRSKENYCGGANMQFND